MSNDYCHFLICLTDAARIPADHGARIEGMKKSPARELRNTSNLHLRQHFIRHRRISNECLTFCRVSFTKPFHLIHRFTGIIYKSRDIIRKQSAQIAGMDTFPAGHEGIPHLLIHHIHTCTDRSNETASSHRNVYSFKSNTLFLEEIDDGIASHAGLIHYGFILGDLFCRMSKILLKELLSGIIKTDLCGS